MSDCTILINGVIITMDSANSRAQALAFEQGQISRVGRNEDMKGLIDQGCSVVDLGKKTVLPGFIDTHSHIMMTGTCAAAVHLDDVRNLEQIQERIAERVSQTEKEAWVRGSFLNEQNIVEKRMPTRYDLDSVAPENPVVIYHQAWHICSFNTRALEMLNVRPGMEGLDMESGQPTGVIRDPCMVTFAFPVLSRLTSQETKLADLEQGARMALAGGITTVHALEGGELWPGDAQIVCDNLDRLPVRVVCFDQSMDLKEIEELGLPRVGGCICSDGEFEARTAALFEPYADDPDNYGVLTYSQEVMDKFIRDANRAGLQVAVHCEADRSIEQVLWAMEKALRDFPRTDHRHRIEHLELPTLNQIDRMARAGIMASMQPAFIPLFVGEEKMEIYERYLGKPRLRWVHPYRTILNFGIPISGGSDSPVTPLNPLTGVQAAVNHPNPDERVTLREALEMFTVTAAWSAFEEEEKGAIEPGKLADLVVLAEDPFQVAADRIGDIEVESVFVGGRRYDLEA